MRRCCVSGIMDIGPCKKDAPLVVSFPHYLFADEKHLDSVVGLNPKKDKHEFYLESDPLTGVTLSVRARFQVGVILERVFGLGFVQACILLHASLPACLCSHSFFLSFRGIASTVPFVFSHAFIHSFFLYVVSCLPCFWFYSFFTSCQVQSVSVSRHRCGDFRVIELPAIC